MINNLDCNSRLSMRIKNLEQEISEIHSTLAEIKNNLQFYNQTQRQLLNDMQTKFSQQFKSQFEEIHYLQYNLQKTQQSEESIEDRINQITQEDLKVIESFLRLIAANQMIQETYLHDSEDNKKARQ